MTHLGVGDVEAAVGVVPGQAPQLPAGDPDRGGDEPIQPLEGSGETTGVSRRDAHALPSGRRIRAMVDSYWATERPRRPSSSTTWVGTMTRRVWKCGRPSGP